VTTRLYWWLTACLSLLLTGAGWYAYGDSVLATDKTFITIGIVVAYLVMTAWIGIAIHTGRETPAYWANYMIGLMPAAGLVGTLIGIVTLFGLQSGGVDMNNGGAILAGLGTAIYTTLAGLVYSEALFLQLRVLRHG
jgi:hypothetical protein